MEFDYTKALYRLNNFGQPTVWFAEVNGLEGITLYHGIVGKTITKETAFTTRIPKEDVASRFRAKRKTGYKYLGEVKDNTILPVEESLRSYLLQYLPKDHTTADGSLLPMLAKAYDNKDNKLFKKVSRYIGQPKINGLRCFISATNNGADMFKPIRLKFQSREGTYWYSLDDLESYLLNALSYTVLRKMVDENYILDGELYIPGEPVNKMNEYVKTVTSAKNKQVQYWCYDIAIDSMSQEKRCDIRYDLLGANRTILDTTSDHMLNTTRLIHVSNVIIRSEEDATRWRNKFIDCGYEGLILRKPDAEYQYGKRNLSMIKYKRSTDGWFVIVDIFPEGIKRPDIPLLRLRNDVNDELFDVSISGNIDYQKSILINKNKYIGKTIFVEYGERSGVKQVPFHAKRVSFSEYE